jgi:MoaA/NifB/PqqE/SkfB family radical SAM enzyme
MWGYSLNGLAKMYLSVTYRCNNRCYFCCAECPRVTDELNTQEWKTIIDKIRDLGIPSISFTGGEPTLRDDLVDLVAYASRNLSVGLITNGKLLMANLCGELEKAGLAYAQITVHSFEKAHDSVSGVVGSWGDTIKGIQGSLSAGINTLTNTTLMRSNYKDITSFVIYIYNLGVRHMCF